MLFCQLMLRHHLGGIHMAEAIISLSHDAQVVDLAKQMKNAQQLEITNMQRLLAGFGAQPLPS